MKGVHGIGDSINYFRLVQVIGESADESLAFSTAVKGVGICSMLFRGAMMDLTLVKWAPSSGVEAVSRVKGSDHL
jgi:hypothetical protein